MAHPGVQRERGAGRGAPLRPDAAAVPSAGGAGRPGWRGHRPGAQHHKGHRRPPIAQNTPNPSFKAALQRGGEKYGLTGILRTTDGGAAWQQLATKPAGSGGLAGLNVESVVPTTLGGDAARQVVLAAAHDWNGFTPANFGNAGVYRSTAGGATLQRVLHAPPT